MVQRCYYCERIFESKEKLYEHLNEHANASKASDESDEEIIDDFNKIKSGEFSRMNEKNK